MHLSDDYAITKKNRPKYDACILIRHEPKMSNVCFIKDHQIYIKRQQAYIKMIETFLQSRVLS